MTKTCSKSRDAHLECSQRRDCRRRAGTAPEWSARRAVVRQIGDGEPLWAGGSWSAQPTRRESLKVRLRAENQGKGSAEGIIQKLTYLASGWPDLHGLNFERYFFTYPPCTKPGVTRQSLKRLGWRRRERVKFAPEGTSPVRFRSEKEVVRTAARISDANATRAGQAKWRGERARYATPPVRYTCGSRRHPGGRVAERDAGSDEGVAI
ncbi:hypothetical protein OBBRIDRAFT_805165 [Obba rivulosa]|uniref:Uncharacterized protein n=1 Tax=Obba rivulosa TaxID=1052685 RepID=A0A8E2AT09_9APHY|nr:hypothetical protein OBBRIDRAFT_805165 [Obba rivulosa]